MGRHRSWLVVLLLGMASVVSANPADEDAGAWIERMTQAVRSLSYEGTFVYVHSGKLESMQVIHAVREGEERERLITLNGMEREVIRDNKSVICILPHAKAVSVSEHSSDLSFPVVLPKNLNELTDHYDIHLRGDARIAGRAAKVVVIVPKDAYRYGYRLFLDAEHALPLQTDMLNGLGIAVAQTMFTALNVDPAIRVDSSLSSLEQDGYTRIYEDSPQQMPISDPSPWRFKYFPTLSVYVEKMAEEGTLQGRSRMGAINVYGFQLEGYQITAVGEVPAKTV